MTHQVAPPIKFKSSRLTLDIGSDHIIFILGVALAIRVWLLFYADNISSILSRRVELTNNFIGLQYSN